MGTLFDEMPRPLRVLLRDESEVPGIYRSVESIRLKRKLAGVTWPDWCYLPAAIMNESLSMGDPIDQLWDVYHCTALAAWRMTKGVYRFDPDVYSSIKPIDPDARLSIDELYRLPEWCIYIEFPERVRLGWDEHGRILYSYGHFVFLNYDDIAPSLAFVADLEFSDGDDQFSLLTFPFGSTSIRGACKETIRLFGDVWHEPTLISQMSHLMALLMYIISANDEIRDAGGSDRAPQNPRPPKTSQKNKEKRRRKRFQLRSFDHPTIWEVGWRMGPELRRKLREYEESEASNGTIKRKTPRPHIRVGHRHRYWTGPRNDPSRRKLLERWIKPILVGGNNPDEIPATIRPVE